MKLSLRLIKHHGLKTNVGSCLGTEQVGLAVMLQEDE
jgi:hypothetical protein